MFFHVRKRVNVRNTFDRIQQEPCFKRHVRVTPTQHRLALDLLEPLELMPVLLQHELLDVLHVLVGDLVVVDEALQQQVQQAGAKPGCSS